MSTPCIVISIELLLFIYFCHFISVVFLFLFPLRQQYECVYSSFSIVSGSFLFLYIFFSSSVIYDWFMGFAMGISCFASLFRAIFFSSFLILNGSWVWVWVCFYSRFIIIFISFHLHHILTCCLLRLRSTISIPYEQFHMVVFFVCLLLLTHMHSFRSSVHISFNRRCSLLVLLSLMLVRHFRFLFLFLFMPF